jgi:hypothetical protein
MEIRNCFPNLFLSSFVYSFLSFIHIFSPCLLTKYYVLEFAKISGG